MVLRINVGCGRSPTLGWKNFDNSFSIRLAKIPLLPRLLKRFNLLDRFQYDFIEFSLRNRIEFGDGTKHLPLQDETVEALYSSHMLEHLDRDEADKFLQEAFRVLRPEGIIRLAVPDISKQVELYSESGDADSFIENTFLCVSRPTTLKQRLKFLLFGARHHQWMYDGQSLCRLLQTHGFVNTDVIPGGETKIADHEPLDLWERAAESVYVEAEKPEHDTKLHR